ncbi:MAG TPA: aldo/keto reductase [Noviherbaspirillum sp.]|uniref:aldo/keto reductase n=1 Tax=Noviherbaspirillum sp. TaxID=1926288 RepID=UPI002B49EAF3|nr:aldo/keto reductase [Noviherbaspirillum sp.]HJV84237.1 aldo/keto reductase [Noviherbaspirillum sp.]
MTRKIGSSDIEVAPLAFGGNVFGWTADETTSFSLLDHFVASGMNLIDTADVYSRWAPGHSGGESETIIGKWLKRSGKRDRVVIATKVGMEMGPDKKGLRKEYIRQAVEDSLRRLQTDYIDLYQSHTDDADTPLEETLEAYAELVRQGKVRVIGASNYSAERLEQALDISRRHGFPVYQCLQPHYNLVERSDFESTLEPVCLKHRIGVIPYYSLASGFLTGKYRSEADLAKSVRGTRAKNYLNERGIRILTALDDVAKRAGATPAQVALAWLMARPAITAPIASATSIQQLDELIGATRLKLDQTAIDQLTQASA